MLFYYSNPLLIALSTTFFIVKKGVKQSVGLAAEVLAKGVVCLLRCKKFRAIIGTAILQQLLWHASSFYFFLLLFCSGLGILSATNGFIVGMATIVCILGTLQGILSGGRL